MVSEPYPTSGGFSPCSPTSGDLRPDYPLHLDLCKLSNQSLGRRAPIGSDLTPSGLDWPRFDSYETWFGSIWSDCLDLVRLTKGLLVPDSDEDLLTDSDETSIWTSLYELVYRRRASPLFLKALFTIMTLLPPSFAKFQQFQQYRTFLATIQGDSTQASATSAMPTTLSSLHSSSPTAAPIAKEDLIYLDHFSSDVSTEEYSSTLDIADIPLPAISPELPQSHPPALWLLHLTLGTLIRLSVGLAGLRIGYGAFPLSIIEYLWRAKQPYNVSVAAEVSACAALKNPAYLENVKVALVQERERLFKLLKEVPFLNPYPSHSNFILCEVTSGMDAKKLKEDLANMGVMIRHYNNKELKGYVRVSVGKPEHTDALMECLNCLC
ncbi:histidinol phosphate aminotransferase 1 [Actinidia rufa]|uniref:histidinol-phosphate transaminase n=1 Tax=Actinidia rufa TaxID=165716 RepID=A0A7J0GY12_9ERIC|nr:histidinol phosphate aminotransferase 1 [Actinidia rufa]